MKQSVSLELAIAALAITLFAAPGVRAQEAAKPAGCKIPEEAAKKENPSKADAGSVGEGKRLFQSQCAMCHGKEGDGKGDIAAAMNLNLRDYRSPEAMKNVTDGAMFYVLAKGCGTMPGEEGRLKSDQMWNLVNFIRSLSKKEEKKEASQP